MASYIEVDGDATKPVASSSEEIIVIPHCCNNIGAWGAGFVLALNKTFGKAPYNTYKDMEKESPNGLKNRLGEICECKVSDNIYVVNMIAQDGVRGSNNPKPIKYWALIHCMEGVRLFVGTLNHMESPYSDARRVVLHCPKFGSDLAGGNWEFIKELILETWVDHDIDVVVYNYKP